jgi:integrase/recombinase XerD
MSALSIALTEYLSVRRALGFKLYATGISLEQFIHFVEAECATIITQDLALRWATQPKQASPSHWARRLGMVRQFAHYCHALDARTEIPPAELIPARYKRKPPYLYSDEEVRRLIQAAGQLVSTQGLRAATYRTFFALLAVTGMRVSEPLALNRDDVDLNQGALMIRDSKFGKSRWLPIHSTTQCALQRYIEQRDELFPTVLTKSFFISEQGIRLTKWSVRYTFVKISHQIGLRGPQDHYGPRLHDLRHRFAIRTLLHWYRSGMDVERHLPELAAYLGHAHVNDTYWYLSATPELMALVVQRWESDQTVEETP